MPPKIEQLWFLEQLNFTFILVPLDPKGLCASRDDYKCFLSVLLFSGPLFWQREKGGVRLGWSSGGFNETNLWFWLTFENPPREWQRRPSPLREISAWRSLRWWRELKKAACKWLRFWPSGLNNKTTAICPWASSSSAAAVQDSGMGRLRSCSSCGKVNRTHAPPPLLRDHERGETREACCHVLATDRWLEVYWRRSPLMSLTVFSSSSPPTPILLAPLSQQWGTGPAVITNAIRAQDWWGKQCINYSFN